MAILELVKIRDKIAEIIEAANTVGGQPRPLNFGMNSDIKEVFKLNPELFESQANRVNSVWVWIDTKRNTRETIAGNQLNAKRRGEVDIKIGGVIFNSMVSASDGDPAADDHYLLMENIEEILRNNSQLDGTVEWHFTTDVKYFESNLGEETNMRAGLLNMEVTKFY